MYAKILVPLDGSERAERILPHVEGLARCLGSTLLFIQVIEPVYDVIDQSEMINIALKLMDRNEAEARAYLDRLTDKFKALGLEARGCVERGPVVTTIIDMAERESVDLIAMASHGRTGLARAFYGSVAAGVLHQVDRPLLLIRAEGPE